MAAIYNADFENVDLPYNLIKLTGDDGNARYPLLVDVNTNEEWFGS